MKGSSHVTGLVTSRYDVTPELWVVRIRPEKEIQFVPGQYVTIGLAGERKVIERPYSLISSPCDPELEFFVELVHGGRVSAAEPRTSSVSIRINSDSSRPIPPLTSVATPT